MIQIEVDKRELFYEIYRMLREHDWYYEYSDDYRVFTNGSRSLANIRYFIKHNDNSLGTLQSMFNSVKNNSGKGVDWLAIEEIYLDEYLTEE